MNCQVIDEEQSSLVFDILSHHAVSVSFPSLSMTAVCDVSDGDYPQRIVTRPGQLLQPGRG